MRLPFLTELLLVALLLSPGAAAAATADLTPDQWRQDLEVLARELPKRHTNPFHRVSKARFQQEVAAIAADIGRIPSQDVPVRFLRLTALVGDAHTIARPPGDLPILPLQLFWFGDDLRVTMAASPYEGLIGARVLKIGGVDVVEIRQRLRATVLSQDELENPSYVLNATAAQMGRPQMLRSVGVAMNGDATTFEVEGPGGLRGSSEVAAVIPEVDPASGLARLRLTSNFDEQPLWAQRPTETFWFTWLEGPKAVYVNFRRYPNCSLLGCPAFKELLAFIDEKKPQKLVVDLRQNFGGDATKVRNWLLPELRKREINQPGRLFVLTGRRTFSAALWNVADFKKQTAAITVGEAPGGRPNGFAENDEFTLPNSKIVVSYSTRYYRMWDQDVPTLEPDHRIAPTADDYFSGRDPVLDWALAYGR